VGASLAGVLLLGAAVAGCAGGGAGTSPAVGAEEFVNPVVHTNFPDPALLESDGTFYLYATEGEGRNIQTMTSSDLVSWEPGEDALPQLGSWALPGKTWAPEVIQVGDGFVMFYTAADEASGRQCIGRAVASEPAGPFVDDSDGPFVCQAEMGGSIDPNPIRTPDGSLYLYWKNDGNCCGERVDIWGQELDADGASSVGRPVALLSNTQAWEGDLVEAPEMIVNGADHVLLYAANAYNTDRYAQGYASCEVPLGPCIAAPEPLLQTNSAAAGPGHGYVFERNGKTWIIYHAWPPDTVGFVTPGRQLWLDPGSTRCGGTPGNRLSTARIRIRSPDRTDEPAHRRAGWSNGQPGAGD
jgi:beta-xylosidase